jgi:hypothetical protein
MSRVWSGAQCHELGSQEDCTAPVKRGAREEDPARWATVHRKEAASGPSMHLLSNSSIGPGCLMRFAFAAAVAVNSALVIAINAFAAAPIPQPPTSDVSRVLQVGPSRSITSIAEAARTAKDGAVVEVDAGEYPGDVAVWNQARITLKSVGGRARLVAGGMAAEGKAIWVARVGEMTVTGFDFVGAHVADRNGAGIRLEKGSLTVRDCSFTNNENGILTSNDKEIVLRVENSEFGHNGFGDGQSHNLYAGTIARLEVTGSYFHHARTGHLLKSRARLNEILYNRLTDETGGTASYELEFANGGVAYVIGNIIQQDSQTENPHLISYGAEGYPWPKNELYLVHNTLVDKRPKGGIFLRVAPGAVTVKASNNLLVGQGRLEDAIAGDYRNNPNVDWQPFELAAREDYRLKRDSRWVGQAVDPGSANGLSLMPTREYVHPTATQPLTRKLLSPGAVQSLRQP